MLTIPVLFTVFLMMIHFGQALYTKLALKHATHVAAQMFAKTDDCGTAQNYFRANFNFPDSVTIACNAAGHDRKIEARYQYQANTLVFLMVPALELTADSTAYLEKPE